jgi:hypothetical protein
VSARRNEKARGGSATGVTQFQRSDFPSIADLIGLQDAIYSSAGKQKPAAVGHEHHVIPGFTFPK